MGLFKLATDVINLADCGNATLKSLTTTGVTMSNLNDKHRVGTIFLVRRQASNSQIKAASKIDISDRMPLDPLCADCKPIHDPLRAQLK